MRYKNGHKKNPSTQRNALKQCLKWHNVIGQSSGKQAIAKNLNVDELKDNNTELVLIDDQARQDGINWVDIVYGWVYGKSKPEEQEDNSIGPDVYRIGEEMIYSVSPQFVIDKLESGSDIRFNLNFTKDKNAILLFDLYLFPTNDQTEIKYFKEVIEKTEKCIGFLDVNIKTLKRIVKEWTNKEKDVYDEQLSIKKKIKNKEKEIDQLRKLRDTWREEDSNKQNKIMKGFKEHIEILKKDKIPLKKDKLDNRRKINTIKKEITDLKKQLAQAEELNQIKYRFEDNLKEELKVMRGLKKEIKSLKEKINSLSENDRLNGLTLLPRLVALMDPSIPIIIFSSTGKRSMIEKFKGYNNIITCFEKSRVLGYHYVDVELARHNFENAIEEAMRFIEVRKLFQQFLVLKDFTEESKPLLEMGEYEDKDKLNYIIRPPR